MSDMKKLFKRDYLYWLVVSLIMLGLLAYMRLEVFEKYINEPIKVVRSGILGTAFLAQVIKILTQETKNRAEILNLFPVKSQNILTYHYASGLFIVGIPLLIQAAIIQRNCQFSEKMKYIFLDTLWTDVAKAVIVFMLHYSFLILCRKLTNHVAGTVFTFIILEFAMQVAAGRCLGMYWDNVADNRIQNWIFWAVMTVVFIILSYIAEQKKDYAMNGFYAFSVAHWIVMGIVFAEVCYVFRDVYENIPRAATWILTITATILITSGVHFLTRAKNI